MTTSEMIQALIELQGKYGDLIIVAGGVEDGEVIEHVEFYDDLRGPVIVIE